MSKKKEKKKKDKIELDKDAYKQMMSEMKDLRRNQNILLQTADKKSMARYMQQNKKDQPKIMKLGKLDGKVIVGWKMEQNKVGKNENNQWVEKQTVRIIFDDGTDRLISYQNFAEEHTRFDCKRIGIEHDEENDRILYKLESLEDETAGETYKVEDRFVNP